MIKKCSKCGEEKPATVEYFYKHYNGLRPDCKVCCAERKKAYYEEHKGDYAERGKAYREAQKEAIAEKKKVHYEANKEAILKQKKAYREAQKEAIAERDKTRYEENKEAIAEKRKAYYRTPKGKWSRIKSVAKRRDINFSLPFKLYESNLWGKPCHYCGCEIEVTGLDRKDNDKGYTPDNVVPCCGLCNGKKETKPYQVFIEEMRNE